MEMTSFKRRTGHEPEDEGWLITFADMCVLLMSFFILMFALSSSDPKELMNVAKSLRDKGFYDTTTPHIDPLEEVKKELSVGVGVGGYQMFIAPSESAKGVDIDLASSAFFEANSARFSAKALPMLQLIADRIIPLANEDFTVEVEGHTDDTPIANEQFPSNWELSAARAATIVRYLVAQKFPPAKLRVIGYGDSRPKAQNHDEAGHPIPSNQDLNRRIVVHIVRGEDN